jgi:hypothetical protein
MDKIFNYKKILQILWNKYFRATFNFTTSKRDIQDSKQDYATNYFIKIKYNPKGYITKNVNWVLIQKAFGDIDKQI